MLAIVSIQSVAQAVENLDGVAIIIGNRSYSARIPAVDYAHRDAAAITRYVTDILGFDAANVIQLRDATMAQMVGTFGNERDYKGKLWRYLDPGGGSDVVVYFSGHGVPGQRSGKSYLLPVDAHPDQAEINGYPLDLLYKNLGELKARSVTVLIDACFSGESPRGVLIRSASPVFLKSKKSPVPKQLTILTAASGSQLASWDEKARHGLFTEYFLRAVYGEADENGNSKVTAAETMAFLNRFMTRSARREYGREQTAMLLGNGNRIFAALSPVSPPGRPNLSESTKLPVPGTVSLPEGTSEDDFWRTIKDSRKPADFRAYLEKFPEGTYASLARLKLKHAEKFGEREQSRFLELEKKIQQLEEEQKQRPQAGSGASKQYPPPMPYIPATGSGPESQAKARLQWLLNQRNRNLNQGEQPKSLKDLLRDE